MEKNLKETINVKSYDGNCIVPLLVVSICKWWNQ